MSALGTLRVRRWPEPYSPVSRDESLSVDERRPILVANDVGRRLAGELVRYVDGEVGGRSFLVAGHRGSGKTTTVLAAIQTEERRRAGTPTTRARSRRPLRVHLLGPTVVAPLDRGSDRESDGEAADQDVETFLRRLTIGLFMAVAEEFVESVRARGGRAVDLAEQLEAELCGAVSPAGLRSLFDQLGAVSEGVLFPSTLEKEPALTRPADKLTRPADKLTRPADKLTRPADKYDDYRERHLDAHPQDPLWGLREASVLFAASLAFQRAIGTRTVKQENNSGEARAASVRVEGKSTDWSSALLGLATGAGTGAGMASVFGDALGALFGAGLGLATFLGLGWSASRSASREQTAVRRFEENTEPLSLSRLLPQLIHRLRTVGLCPVFVVDELDKLDPPSPGQSRDERRKILRTGTLARLLNHTKYLVGEEAMFLFLADREFYELLAEDQEETPYSARWTWFSDQLFVSPDPQDLEPWLDEVLTWTPSALVRSRPPTSDPERPTQVALAVLRLWLRYTSRLNMRALRRTLHALEAPDGALRMSASELLSDPKWLFPAAIQLLTEHELAADASLAATIAGSAFERQQVLDVMYEPWRRWERGEDALPDPMLPPAEPAGAPAEPAGAEVGSPAKPLPAGLQRPVRRALQRVLLGLAGEPQSPWSEARSQTPTEGPAPLWDLLDFVAGTPLLGPLHDGRRPLRFAFGGESAQAAGREPPLREIRTWEAELAERWSMSPSDLLDGCLFPAIPDWDTVRRALHGEVPTRATPGIFRAFAGAIGRHRANVTAVLGALDLPDSPPTRELLGLARQVLYGDGSRRKPGPLTLPVSEEGVLPPRGGDPGWGPVVEEALARFSADASRETARALPPGVLEVLLWSDEARRRQAKEQLEAAQSRRLALWSRLLAEWLRADRDASREQIGPRSLAINALGLLPHVRPAFSTELLSGAAFSSPWFRQAHRSVLVHRTARRHRSTKWVLREIGPRGVFVSKGPRVSEGQETGSEETLSALASAIRADVVVLDIGSEAGMTAAHLRRGMDELAGLPEHGLVPHFVIGDPSHARELRRIADAPPYLGDPSTLGEFALMIGLLPSTSPTPSPTPTK